MSCQSSPFTMLFETENNSLQTPISFVLSVVGWKPLTARRSEAHAIPSLLFAPLESTTEGTPDPSIYNNGLGDTRGFYSDGAYIAAPSLGPILPPGFPLVLADSDVSELDGTWSHEMSPKEAYTSSLVARFLSQRAKLQAISAPHAAHKLTPKTPIILPKRTRDAYRVFQGLVHSHDPTPQHLAALSKAIVLRMLDLSTQLFKRRKNVGGRYSAWVWGLLCRLGDAGTLDSDAVSVVRELGKKAVWVGIGFLDPDATMLTEGYGAHMLEDHGEQKDLDSGQPCHEDSYVLSKANDDNYAVVNGKEANGQRRGCRPNTSSSDPPEFDHHEALEPAPLIRRRRNTSSPTPPSEEIRELASIEAPTAPGSSVGAIETVAEAKARLLQRLESPPRVTWNTTTALDAESGEHGKDQPCPNINTCATIDMIVTIVGELYGQRDLLEFRDSWGGETGLWG